MKKVLKKIKQIFRLFFVKCKKCKCENVGCKNCVFFRSFNNYEVCFNGNVVGKIQEQCSLKTFGKYRGLVAVPIDKTEIDSSVGCKEKVVISFRSVDSAIDFIRKHQHYHQHYGK